jgi:hypothetical protein
MCSSLQSVICTSHSVQYKLKHILLPLNETELTPCNEASSEYAKNETILISSNEARSVYVKNEDTNIIIL